MVLRMKIEYDAVGDILYLDEVAPSEGQRSTEVAEGVLIRRSRETGAVEGVEVQGFVARQKAGITFEVARTLETVSLKGA